MSSHTRVLAFMLGAFLLLDGVLLAAWLTKGPSPRGGALVPTTGDYPEIQDLAGENLSFKDLSAYFKELAERKGAPYAFAVLKVAPIPPDIDMHLLGHIVGDELYKQQGAQGIKLCTQDFRNACSHSIVVGLFLERGEGAIPEITNACREAPGGSGAYTMCFHGLGHGVLAFTGYKLEETIPLCRKIGAAGRGGSEFAECVGGAVMEIIGGGFHNRELWLAQSPKYLKADAPLEPCATDLIPEEARGLCYTYLTPHLFRVAGADLARPQPEHFEKAFTFCDGIPANEVGNRRACLGGFGKEFVVLAKNRDIRNIDKMTPEELAKVYEWCALAPHAEGLGDCVNTAAASLYWGGENDRAAVIAFCGLVADPDARSSCFANIIGAVSHFVKDRSYREAFCNDLPADFGATCRETLLSRGA